MNRNNLIVFFIGLNLAALSECCDAVLSATNNGIYVAVASFGLDTRYSTNRSIPYDNQLLWCPYSNLGHFRIYYFNPNYGFRMKMLDPDGKETARTPLGQKYGSRFDHIL